MIFSLPFEILRIMHTTAIVYTYDEELSEVLKKKIITQGKALKLLFHASLYISHNLWEISIESWLISIRKILNV